LAERLARRTNTLSLFVPESGASFVELDDGHVSLDHVLIPVDHHPDPHAAVLFATRAARGFGGDTVKMTLLHVGDETDMPDMDLPIDPAWKWNKIHIQGESVEGIISTAEDHQADLICMVTAGHEGILDVLRGNTTEQVLRKTSCPLLAVTAEWAEGLL
jgi:nucleotide-binding universal stress UspA family protein